MIKSYKDLEIWKLSITVAKLIYRLTNQLPKEEIYGLSSQIRRSAVSISSNIAEGFQRQHKKEFRQFLYQCLGSLAELETQLLITNDVHKIKLPEDLSEAIDILGKKIRTLIKVVNASSERQATSV